MATVNVSSFMNGNMLQAMEANTVGEILQQQNIATNDCNIDVQGANGEEKPSRVTTVLADGDVVQIMRQSNKSGTKNDIDVGIATKVVYTNSLPQELTVTKRKYPLHEMKKKGSSFDLPFRSISKRQTRTVRGRVDAAIHKHKQTHPTQRFCTRILANNGPKYTHLVRVWRVK